MILSFKPHFKQLILDGTKIHTIRTDAPDRWHAGNIIHAATGVRTSDYDCFMETVCKSTQRIDIIYDKHGSLIIKVDGRVLELGEMQQLAFNDGFAGLYDFNQWFCNGLDDGKLIINTDMKHNWRHCFWGLHKLKIIEKCDVLDDKGAQKIGKRYVLRCLLCGKIKTKYISLRFDRYKD